MPLHGADGAPDPLTPRDCDISDWPGMMLDVARLQKSRAWLICKSKPHLAFYMLNLWFAAWHAVPAASLENDDEVLADLARSPTVEHWLTIKADVLRGFMLCSDGRWYHEVIAVKALEAWIEKIGGRISSGAGNAKRWGGEFNDAPLKGQLQIAKELLQALDPMSKVFARSRAGVTTTTPTAPKKAPRRSKATASKAAPDADSAGGIPSGDDQHPGGVAIEVKGSEGKGSEENYVGGKPPTTPGADAPGGQGTDVDSEDGAELGPDRLPPEDTKPAAKPRIEPADRNLVLPEWLQPHADAFFEFEKNRWAQHSKAPYTANAQRLIVRELEKLLAAGQDLTQVLLKSARAGWRDVFPIKGAGVRPIVPIGGSYTGRNYSGGELEHDFVR